jgi:uncharacterized protein
MKMSLDRPGPVNVVTGYEPGRVRIGGRHFTSSIVVFADRVIDDWSPATVDQLGAVDLRPLLDRGIDVLILGTGERQVFPPPAIFADLIGQGIGFEVMANAAACRTYNILLAEERPAALALILGTAE